MGALLNRLRRAEARVNALAEELGCSMTHLTEAQCDALLWEQIWGMGGPRAVVDRARARGDSWLADFIPRFVILCPPQTPKMSPPRNEALWYAEVFNVPPGNWLIDQLTDAQLDDFVKGGCRTGAGTGEVPTDPCATVDLSHLSEADQNAWLWRGIDLIGGEEAFKRRLCENGLSDLAAGLADVLAACPRPADLGSAILEDWVLAAFPYDPNPPDRLPRRKCWVGPIQGSRRPSATSKP